MRSLKSLAQELGVSVATVSNALNHKGKLSPALREKILALAKAYGYEPSAHARVLHGQRMPVLGIIVPSVHDGLMQGFFQGADRAARAAGYSTVFSISNQPGEDPSEMEQQAVARFHALRIGGVLYLPWSGAVEGAVERELDKREIPFVRLYRKGRNGRDPAVTVDHARGVELAMAHLSDLGHRRIGLMTPTGTESRAIRRAFDRLTPQRKGEEWVFSDSSEGLDRLIKKRVTAILASSDDQALTVANQLRNRGISVPKEISLVGFRDTIVAQSMTPRLTTLHVPTEEIGYTAAQWLIRRMQDGEGIPAINHVIAPTLVVRESTCPPAAR